MRGPMLVVVPCGLFAAATNTPRAQRPDTTRHTAVSFTIQQWKPRNKYGSDQLYFREPTIDVYLQYCPQGSRLFSR